MKTSQRLTRTLLITILLLGALWIASPPSGEALDSDPFHGNEITWELTGDAIQRTAAGDCSDTGSLDTCREECYLGYATGNFDCFSN